MSWYGADGVWTKRAAITLAPTNNTDFELEMPGGWDDFWSTIDSSGNECRVTDAQGNELDWDWDGFDKADRTGTILINNYPGSHGTDRATCAWLYYGSTTNQGAFGGTAGAGPFGNAHIELARPAGPYQVRHQPSMPGSARPLKVFAKTSGEIADLWVFYGGIAAQPWTAVNEAYVRDEILYVIQTVEDDTGADQSAMYDETRIRFVWIPREGMWVRVQVIGGTDGEVYTSSLETATVDDHDQLSERAIVDTRVGWRVRDVRLTS